VDTIEFKMKMREIFLSMKYAHRTSLNQIALRCPLCGDSKKDPKKTRFYVKIDMENDVPIVFHCFNCDESGIITPSVLRSVGISDLKLNTDLLNYNKSAKKNIAKTLGIKNNYLNYKVPDIKDSDLNRIKKEYIENRLGLFFSYDELKRFKIVFSLLDFLKTNKINDLTVYKQRALTLENDYVGFLSANNSLIVYRDITDKNKMRYDKYPIIKDELSNDKFYTIPNTIDVMTSDKLTINIAEGTFDILGVYYHIMNCNDDNNIYIAVMGSGFLAPLQTFISKGIIGSNITINIFSDADKDIRFYNKVIENVYPFVGEINIYYNELEKDYGVPKDRIKLKRFKIPRNIEK